ncbi:hypothetical protein [Levilactobacillus yonginensis]|uniref:hypothetical protein n=1 Tax=Levilactobacillus yonginensis TaxID=1054041 RepID=UPI00345D19BA
MKTKVRLVGLALLAMVVVSGCHAKQNASQSETKLADQPQPSKLTTALKPASQKAAEDAGTQSNHQVTYSRFYYHQNHWRWALTTRGKTIVKGIVTKSQKKDSDQRLTIKRNNGQKMALTLSWLDGGLQSYSLKSSTPQLSRNFIIGDDGTAWKKGVPSELKGTWETGIYDAKRLKLGGKLNGRSSSVDKQAPKEKTYFYILETTLDGLNNSYDQQGNKVGDGAGWGANSNVSYKKLTGGDYLLKSYWTGRKVAPDVYRVNLTGKRLKLIDTLGDTPVMTRKSTKDTPVVDGESSSSSDNGTDNSRSSTTATSGSVDTSNLTTAQVNDWIWTNMLKDDLKGNPDKFAQSDYLFLQDMNKKGNLDIEVHENHSTRRMQEAGASPDVSPRVASYEINAKGELMKQDIVTGKYKVVSTQYGE